MHLNFKLYNASPQKPPCQPVATDSRYQHLVLGHTCPILLSIVLMFKNIIQVHITTSLQIILQIWSISKYTFSLAHFAVGKRIHFATVYVSTFTGKRIATFISLLLITEVQAA